MAILANGVEPAARRLFAVVALVVGGGWWVVALGYGSLMARAIGPMLMTAGDQPRFFAGLLESLGRWWAGLGPGGQILVTALLVAAILAFGGTFALALGAAGVASWVAGHGEGLGALMRDPKTAIRDYLANATPGGVLWDLLDFGLTFIPGSILGKLAKNGLSGILGRLWIERAVRSFPVHVIEHLMGLFDERAAAILARDAAEAHLNALLPAGQN